MDAEEAAQDSLLKVVQKIHDYNGTSQFKTWIHTISYRTAIDYYRKKRHYESIEDRFDLEGGLRADDHVQQDELNKKIEYLLSLLDEDDERLLKLYYLEEMSIKELVGLLGLSESNIKVRLHRSRKWIASQVQQNTRIYEDFR